MALRQPHCGAPHLPLPYPKEIDDKEGRLAWNKDLSKGRKRNLPVEKTTGDDSERKKTTAHFHHFLDDSLKKNITGFHFTSGTFTGFGFCTSAQ